jgi:signal transduction histidine kinase
VPALGEAVMHLAWLPPGVGSLVALARLPAPAAWVEVRSDPGAVLLVVREATGARALPAFFPGLLHDPALLDGAVRCLDHILTKEGPAPPGGFLDNEQSALQAIHRAGLRYAHVAHRLAERSGRCDPDTAWSAGLLAPLGWWAVCAVDPARAAACLADLDHATRPAATESKHWSLNQAAIARRLARRWGLPCWLAAVAGHLGLPIEVARQFGADPALFQIVQLAVNVAQSGPDAARLNLMVGADARALAAALGLPDVRDEDFGAVNAEMAPIRTQCFAPGWQALLREVLVLAAENRRLQGRPALPQMEDAVDDLHRALEEQRAGEAERLQAQKLSALAEFAAGAGHEINNPLAVISGQAQYLLKRLQGPGDKEQETAEPPAGPCSPSAVAASLQTIIQQAQRIHQTLRDLMQFARPARPQKQPLDLAALLEEILAAQTDLAVQRTVRLRRPEPGNVAPPIFLHADPLQLRTMLACLLRNAIEAAPADGWAAVRVESAAPDRVDVVFEDSGRGPDAAQQEHLFDPFYSGRQAGRGRGLGLPTAWRLARCHGGNVRLASPPGGPTRFVLSLPCQPDGQPVEGADPCPLHNGNGTSSLPAAH